MELLLSVQEGSLWIRHSLRPMYLLHLSSTQSAFLTAYLCPTPWSPEPCGAKGQEYCLLITVPGAKYNANTEERTAGRWRKKKMKEEDKEWKKVSNYISIWISRPQKLGAYFCCYFISANTHWVKMKFTYTFKTYLLGIWNFIWTGVLYTWQSSPKRWSSDKVWFWREVMFSKV